MRRGQAMVETVLACLFIMSIFLVAFQLLRMETARILLDHAAARAARARAVGFNDFMCLKSARAAMIPVSGPRIWPDDSVDEVSRVPAYLSADDESLARGILDYEYWRTTSFSVGSGSGVGAVATSRIVMHADDFSMDGKAEVESHFPFYMYDQGR